MLSFCSPIVCYFVLQTSEPAGICRTGSTLQSDHNISSHIPRIQPWQYTIVMLKYFRDLTCQVSSPRLVRHVTEPYDANQFAHGGAYLYPGSFHFFNISDGGHVWHFDFVHSSNGFVSFVLRKVLRRLCRYLRNSPWAIMIHGDYGR